MNAAFRNGLAAVLCLTAGAVMAQTEAKAVAAKSDWVIFAETDPKQCWVVSAPKETVNTRDGRVVAVRRGDIHMFVSFWPETGKLGEVSFYGGYPFASGSSVTLQVGDSKFDLFTDGEVAWSTSPDEDRRIATALKRGVEAVVTGRSSRGTTTKDTFSLIGFTAAFDDALARCEN